MTVRIPSRRGQFCLYLQRHKPGTYIPDPVLRRHPAFYPKANIPQPETMGSEG